MVKYFNTQEMSNLHDLYAIATIKNNAVVGQNSSNDLTAKTTAMILFASIAKANVCFSFASSSLLFLFQGLICILLQT